MADEESFQDILDSTPTYSILKDPIFTLKSPLKTELLNSIEFNQKCILPLCGVVLLKVIGEKLACLDGNLYDLNQQQLAAWNLLMQSKKHLLKKMEG